MPHGAGRPSGDTVEKDDATGIPEADHGGERKKRCVAKASYFRRYRRMRVFGFKWAKAENEWLRDRLTDYIIGRESCSAERRTSLARTPGCHIAEVHLYLGETWIYEGGSDMHAWGMEGRSVMQKKGRYRRWGVIGRLLVTWDIVSEEEYAENQPAPK